MVVILFSAQTRFGILVSLIHIRSPAHRLPTGCTSRLQGAERSLVPIRSRSKRREVCFDEIRLKYCNNTRAESTTLVTSGNSFSLFAADDATAARTSDAPSFRVVSPESCVFFYIFCRYEM